MKITLKNDFHNTKVATTDKGLDSAVTYFFENNGKLNSTGRRIKRALCGIEGCTCGNFLGIRGGRQAHD